ncbi:unnamed protein product [Brassica rapa]|uniref:Uncharacterized protein n=1 Tax=Brassica campestris TaxID=3711 RepID=A0A8D9CTW1_BRACM|nr:unnamed protein product [Brassica rapa]
MCVRQHTQDVRVCLSAHTGRPWLSISTHISTLVLGLSTLALPVDGSGNFGPRGLCVQYTQDGRGCPSAHTGRPWVFVSTHRRFVAVSVCLCVYVRTHMTSVAVRQYTYQHVGRWTQHANPSRGLFGTHRTSVGVRQQSAHTGRLWVSVSTHRTSGAVRVCPSAHTGRLWQSISTHISMLVLGLSTLTLPVDYLGDFGPLHTERPWVSARTHRTSVAVHVCPSVTVSTHRTYVSVHQFTYQHIGSWTPHAGPSCGLFE